MAGEESTDPRAAGEHPDLPDAVRVATAAKERAEVRLLEAQTAQSEAENARKAAEGELAKLRAEIGSTNTALATQMNEQAERGLGVREFVRESLLAIMAGVDDAAAMGRLRALDDGMDGFLPAVTKVGETALGENVSERVVEFDLAVTLSRSANEKDELGGKVSAGLQVGFPGIAKFHVGASGHIERVTSESTSQDRSNRLRFSVPIAYAVQEASVDDE